MLQPDFFTQDQDLPAEVFLAAYSRGWFPMAPPGDEVHLAWLSPHERAVIPLDTVHLPRRLKRTVRSGAFTVTTDTAFGDVFSACAAPRRNQDGNTWISTPIRRAYADLAAQGHAHSIECWRDGVLAGGLYGLAIGGAFFGESMFARERDASKAAFVHLIARLRAAGFALLDSQVLNPHIAQFGAIEIPKEQFLQQLQEAVRLEPDWGTDPSSELAALLERPDSQAA